MFSGKDRVRWLNGMVTNNIRDLAPGHGVYSFILTPQGHNQGDLVAYNRGDYLLATTDREQAPKVTADLQKLHHHGPGGDRGHQRQAGVDRSRRSEGLRDSCRTPVLMFRSSSPGKWSIRCGSEHRHFGCAQRASADGRLRDLACRRECREASGMRLSLPERDAGWQRCAGDVSHRARRSAIRNRSARARSAAGNRPGARAELQQRLLSSGRRLWSAFARAATCIEPSLDLKLKASRRSRERKFAPTTKTWAKSPAQRACHFPVASALWRWAICGAKSQRCRATTVQSARSSRQRHE